MSTSLILAMPFAPFTVMPSFLPCGFMVPFRGTAQWAQWVGEILPTTHAMRIVRGVLLEGNGAEQILAELWPIALFLVVAVWCWRDKLEQGAWPSPYPAAFAPAGRSRRLHRCARSTASVMNRRASTASPQPTSLTHLPCSRSL